LDKRSKVEDSKVVINITKDAPEDENLVTDMKGEIGENAPTSDSNGSSSSIPMDTKPTVSGSAASGVSNNTKTVLNTQSDVSQISNLQHLPENCQNGSSTETDVFMAKLSSEPDSTTLEMGGCTNTTSSNIEKPSVPTTSSPLYSIPTPSCDVHCFL